MLYIGFEDPTENKLINKIRKTKLKNIDNFVYLNCKLWKTFLNKLVAFIWSIELTVGIENKIITNNPTKKILVKLIIENYPDDQIEYLEAENNPENKKAGSRKIPFSKELYIEQDDFMENPPKKFFRLFVGNEVRLKHAYYIKCIGYTKNDQGQIIEIKCTYDPKTKGGWSNDGRKVKGTIHWVTAKHAIDAKIKLYNKLFNDSNPMENANFLDCVNENSVKEILKCKIEPSLKESAHNTAYQFIRKGYFVHDKESTKNNLIFNQTVGLRDSWSKKNK